jgi:hypothetical protein
MDFNDINVDTISALPDGAVLVDEINEKRFNYRASINDNRIMQYHRANAITMIDYKNPHTNYFNPILNISNGLLWAVDLFNKAYIKHFFKDVNIITSVKIMPAEIDTTENIQKIINLCGSMFYPMAISLLMPLFMYTIILEKESKLIEMMKINGMKMRYYWLSNFIFNICLYSITMFFFQSFGMFVMNLDLFAKTSTLLMVDLY